tara:strand:+ start:208 stop:474 length:267 start_codon:yes stop_codon:yes gene_type:complete
MERQYFIKKGTICNYSEVGHYNFVYPSNKTTVSVDDQIVTRMNYIGGGKDKIAVMAKASKLYNAICSKLQEQLVVWIDKKDLKLCDQE